MGILRGSGDGAIELYWEEAGRGDPVVLVGGLTSTVETWGRQVPALAARHRVVTFDNRGSGRTRVPGDDGVRTPERFARDLLALLDGLGLDRVHLVGASMGGMIVQQFAIQWPERLRSLTICCSTFGGPEAVRATPEVLQAMFHGSVSGASPAALRGALEILFHPVSLERRRDAVDFYVGTKEARPHTGEEIARRAAGLARFDVRDAVAKLAVQTLVLTGSDDRLIPTENSRLLAARIPDARLVEIEETAHVFFVERPEAVNAALLGFFGSV